MINPLQQLLTKTPETNRDTAGRFDWATVVSDTPIALELDSAQGEILEDGIDNLTGPVKLGQRVRVHVHGGRVYVYGNPDNMRNTLLGPGTTLTLWHNPVSGWPARPSQDRDLVVQWCSVGYQGIPVTAVPGIDFLRIMDRQAIPNPDPDPGVGETGDVLDSFTFDDQMAGMVPIPSGNWSAAGGNPDNLRVLTAAQIHGTLGCRVYGLVQSRYMLCTTERTAETVVLDMYIRVRSHGSANAYIMGLRDSVDGITRADVRLNSNMTLTIRNLTTAVGQTSEENPLLLNNTYRLSWKISPIMQHLRVYDLTNNEWMTDAAGPITNSLHDACRFGRITTAPDGEMDMDTLRIGDDWLPAYA